MKTVSLFLLAFSAQLHLVLSNHLDPKQQFRNLKYQINNATNSGWTASLGSRSYHPDAISKRVGGSLSFPPDMQIEPTSTGSTHARLLQAYPSSLNLTAKYPNCTSLNTIRDQGNCSSCWALSSSSAISDNACIASTKRGQPNDYFFAQQDILECCSSCAVVANQPCSSGYLYFAYNWAKTVGIVSGDGYNDQPSLCKKYFLAPDYTGPVTNPTCQSTCSSQGNSALTYLPDKKKITNFTYSRGAAAMIAALNTYGSLSIVITIYNDFMTYSSGVYRPSNLISIGGHTVRIIGYGVDPVQGPFWYCANTWGNGWGENGFFRIRRGMNDCTIESTFYFVAQF